MSTREQRRTARRNSEHSTGPVTPEGKAHSRFNAVRHGLCSQQALLPGEDAQALQDLSREFHKSTKPVGPQELLKPKSSTRPSKKAAPSVCPCSSVTRHRSNAHTTVRQRNSATSNTCAA